MLSIQKNLRPAFYMLVSLPATAMGLALSIQISALSWLLTTRYQLDLHQIGLIWAAGPLAGIAGQLLVGGLSDRTWLLQGRRRPYILLGGLLTALMLWLLPRMELIASILGTANMLWVAAAVALILDLAINVSFNPTRSLIADITPPGGARTRGFTWMQSISGLVGVSAYLVSACWGNDVLIHAGLVAVLVMSILPPLLIEEPRALHAAALERSAETGPDVPHSIGWLCLAHGCAWFGVQAMFVYSIAFTQQYLVSPGLTPAAAGDAAGRILAIAFAILNTVGFVVPQLMLEPLARRFGRGQVQAASMALMALAFLVIAFIARTPMALYAAMALAGIGWGALVSLPFAILSERVQGRRMGWFMGVFNLFIVVPQLLVSLVLGGVMQQAQEKSLLFSICGMALAASAAFWLLVSERRMPCTDGLPVAKAGA